VLGSHYLGLPWLCVSAVKLTVMAQLFGGDENLSLDRVCIPQVSEEFAVNPGGF
jgi:hypothetical protein